MSYFVEVQFRKARDYSNEMKDRVIHLLPGPYKVSRQDLNDMDQGGIHRFEFQNEEPASNFAKAMFGTENNTFDVKTSFKVNY